MTNIDSSRNCLRRIINDDQEFSNQSIINVIEKFVKSVNVMEETILVPSRLLDRQVGDSTDSSVTTAEKSHSHHNHHNHHHHHHHHNNKKKSTNIRDHLQNTDLFNLYSMLNSVKTDLLWGRNNEQDGSDELTEEFTLREQNYDNSTMAGVETEIASSNKNETQAPQQQQLNTEGTTQTKGHVRRPSTVSVASSNSSTSTISDCESEVSSNENDSGIESENQKEKDRSLEVARQFRTNLLGLYKSLEQMTEAASYLTARYQSDMGGC